VVLIFLVFCVGFLVLLVFVLCLVRSVACVSGLTILHFPFGFLSRIFNFSSLNMSQYYTLRLYFPYLSVSELVHITVYRPGPVHILLSPGFCPKPILSFDIQYKKNMSSDKFASLDEQFVLLSII